jgi:putative ABC transport system substrate-binding protein
MDRRLFICGVFLSWPFTVAAQSPGKLVRIGFLSAGTYGSLAKRIDAMREGFKQLGYVEGRGLLIEYQFAEQKAERLPELAAELLRRRVDIFVTAGPTATRAAKQVTSTIPIVMAFDTDPVGSKFAASLARPGGNITGLSIVSPELGGKQIELLKQVVPGVSHLAILGDSLEPGNARTVAETERAAERLGIRVQKLDVRGTQPIPQLFQEIMNQRIDALIVMPGSFSTAQRTQLGAQAVQHRLPAVYPWPEFVEEGGLMTYSVRLDDLYRRAATYVDKILKGAKPGELPIEQPYKFDLIINLKAAKAIGLTIPIGVLTRADRVIE